MHGKPAGQLRSFLLSIERLLPAKMIAPLFFLAVGLALVWPGFLPGNILAPVDLLYESPLYEPLRPPGYDEPANPHLFDQAFQFVPWRYHAWNRMRSGDIPLWNPLSATGTPFVATMQSAVFYPVNLSTLPLPFRLTIAASALMRLWIAGFSTYLLLRHYGSSRQAGLLSGASFMLSGFIVGWLGHPHTNVAVWLPALILTLEHILDSDDTRATLRWSGVLALVTGVQFLGGHIETSRDILFAGGVYAVVRLLQHSGEPLRIRGRKLLASGLGGIAGVSVAAVQLLPFIEWLPLSAEYQSRTSGGFTVWHMELQNLLSLPLALVPNLYGNPTWDGQYWSFNPWGSFNESVLYAGTIPLVLAVSALAAWKNDPIIRTWAIIGGFMLGVALRLPIFDWINQIPGFALGHPGRLRLVFIFAVAILAGRGLDRAIVGPRPHRLLMASLATATGAGLGLLLLIAIITPGIDNWNSRAVSKMIEHFDGDPTPPRSVVVCRDRPIECSDELVSAFSAANVEMYLLLPAGLIALLLVIAVRRRVVQQPLLGPGLVAITVAELLVLGWGYNPAVAGEPIERPPPAIQEAAAIAGDSRFTVLQQDSLPDSHMLYGFEDIRGLDFKTAWHKRYLESTGDQIPWLANGTLLAYTGSLVSDLDLGAVVTANPYIVDRYLTEGSMTLARSGDGYYVLEPVHQTPRGVMRFDIYPAGSDEDAARHIEANPDRLDMEVVISGLPDDGQMDRAFDSSGASATVEMVRHDPEHLIFDIATTHRGMLVVSDSYYPGWTAAIDGRPAPIYRANIAFRAVPVAAGVHTVEMRYEPTSVRFGYVVSIVSTLLVCAAIGLSFVERSPVSRARFSRLRT